MQDHSNIVLQAALEAGQVIMGYYRDGFSVERKSDASPVTEADQAADKIIRRHLEVTGIPVISEESAVADFSERKSWKKAWMVDPLDGTKEFIKRTGEFTVNIALLEDGKPTEGLVFAPALGLLYQTRQGRLIKEIYLLQERNVFIKSEAFFLSQEINRSRNVCASISHANSATLSFVERYRSAHPLGTLISIGSSLKFALLAEGKAGIYPRFSPTMEWDTAAGQAILQAAGGNVWDVETGNPIQYNRENLLNGNFIATASHISKGEAFSYLLAS
jgi:3'(2'), 5'-bisphosphate nucleotidase